MERAAKTPAIVVPTYNERETIERLITTILALPLDARVIVVDDNSPDGTGTLVEAIAAVEPRVSTIRRPRKLGLGTAHLAGMRQALAAGYDPVVTMDADYSHHPSYIPLLIEGLGVCDVRIGSRYVPGGGMEGRAAAQRFVSWGANLFARRLLALQATDCTSGFRAYRRAVLESLNLNRIFSEGYSFLIEMLYLCQGGGWRIGETPIMYQDRDAGSSKISRAEIFKAVYTVLRLAGRRLRTAGSRPCA